MTKISEFHVRCWDTDDILVVCRNTHEQELKTERRRLSTVEVSAYMTI
jgi:hypothetical protein